MEIIDGVEVYESSSEAAIECTKKFRYAVVKESISTHCCFEATVFDTSAPIRDYRNYNGNGPKNAYIENGICETFELQDAITICNSLNATNK